MVDISLVVICLTLLIWSLEKPGTEDPDLARWSPEGMLLGVQALGVFWIRFHRLPDGSL